MIQRLAVLLLLVIGMACGGTGGHQPQPLPVFVSSPKNAYPNVGDTVAFSVEVASATAYALQWENELPGGTEWKDVAGETAATLIVPNVTSKLLDSTYRCRATNAGGSVESGVAIIGLPGHPTP
jgi:hypothetical protein